MRVSWGDIYASAAIGALLASGASGVLWGLAGVDNAGELAGAIVGGGTILALLCFVYAIIPCLVAATLLAPLARWRYHSRGARAGEGLRWMIGVILALHVVIGLTGDAGARMGAVLVGAVPLYLATALYVLDRRVRRAYLSSTSRP